MARDGILFSIITPSTGRRPKALQKAVDSVERAARFAGLEKGQVEIIVGFDGASGSRPRSAYSVRCFNLPPDNDRGNGIRDMLVRLADGDRLIFLDDDNMLKPHTLRTFMRHPDTEMVIGHIDTQLAFDMPHLPARSAASPVRPGNIDLLCLCVFRRLVERCGGWKFRGERDADYRNILEWHHHAHSETVIEEVVGIYDAGRNLDRSALSPRQMNLLDRLAEERGDSPVGAVMAGDSGPAPAPPM